MVSGKLLFPLCRSCGESGQTHVCTHTSPEDRVLIGTWTSPELSKVVECGYKILQRIEAWHYPNTSQYNPETCTGGIWADIHQQVGQVETGSIRLPQRVCQGPDTPGPSTWQRGNREKALSWRRGKYHTTQISGLWPNCWRTVTGVNSGSDQTRRK